jgi:hypothetical protein
VRFLNFVLFVLLSLNLRAQSPLYKVSLPGSLHCQFVDTNGNLSPLGKHLSFRTGPKFKEGLICINFKKPHHEEDRWGCMNAKGDTIIKGKYLEAFEFNDGIAKVITAEIQNPVGNSAIEPGFYCQYINLKGDTIIGKSFLANESTLFSSNRAVVKEGQQWFMMSRSGKLRALSPDFLKVHAFSNDWALCNRFNGYSMFIDTMENTVLEMPNQNFTGSFVNGFAIFSIVEGKYGFMNKKGQPVVPCIYDSASNYCENLAAVKIYNKWGFVDAKGKLIIKPIYEKSGNFSEGLCMVKRDSFYGFINTAGAMVIANAFKEVSDFNHGLAAVRDKNGQWGYINKKGLWVLKPQFYLAENFDENGFANVQYELPAKGKGKVKIENALISKQGKVAWKSGGELKVKF